MPEPGVNFKAVAHALFSSYLSISHPPVDHLLHGVLLWLRVGCLFAHLKAGSASKCVFCAGRLGCRLACCPRMLLSNALLQCSRVALCGQGWLSMARCLVIKPGKPGNKISVGSIDFWRFQLCPGRCYLTVPRVRLAPTSECFWKQHPD